MVVLRMPLRRGCPCFVRANGELLRPADGVEPQPAVPQIQHSDLETNQANPPGATSVGQVSLARPPVP